MRRLFVGAMLMCGCLTRHAIWQASQDHGCDEQKISVISSTVNTATLDVCGETRQYRRLGRGDMLDVTNLNSMPERGSRPPTAQRATEPLPEGGPCSPHDFTEMREAGVSESAIALACLQP
jgi:hypothetical protein